MTDATATLVLVIAVTVGGFAIVATAMLGATVVGGRLRRQLRGRRASLELRLRRSS
jgi:hypothetical protein